MAVGNFESGHVTLKKLCDAFGLDGRYVRRLVIDCPVDDILTLHVEELPTVEQVARAAVILADVTTQQSEGRQQWQAVRSDDPLMVITESGVDIKRGT